LVCSADAYPLPRAERSTLKKQYHPQIQFIFGYVYLPHLPQLMMHSLQVLSSVAAFAGYGECLRVRLVKYY
jgi:hypothetical protein